MCAYADAPTERWLTYSADVAVCLAFGLAFRDREPGTPQAAGCEAFIGKGRLALEVEKLGDYRRIPVIYAWVFAHIGSSCSERSALRVALYRSCLLGNGQWIQGESTRIGVCPVLTSSPQSPPELARGRCLECRSC